LASFDAVMLLLILVVITTGAGMFWWAAREAMPVYRPLFLTLSVFCLFWTGYYAVLVFTDVRPGHAVSVARGVTPVWLSLLVLLMPWTAVYAWRRFRSDLAEMLADETGVDLSKLQRLLGVRSDDRRRRFRRRRETS
jgi:hypothetical protein